MGLYEHRMGLLAKTRKSLEGATQDDIHAVCSMLAGRDFDEELHFNRERHLKYMLEATKSAIKEARTMLGELVATADNVKAKLSSLMNQYRCFSREVKKLESP